MVPQSAVIVWQMGGFVEEGTAALYVGYGA